MLYFFITIIDIIMDAFVITSFLVSIEDAFSDDELIFFDVILYKYICIIFIISVINKTIKVTLFMINFSGLIILFIDLITNVVLITNMNIDIGNAEMYSYLAYPYGCVFVGFFVLNLKPTIVIIDEVISVKLLTASVSMLIL